MLSTIHCLTGVSIIIVYGYRIGPDLLTWSGEDLQDTRLIEYLDKHITMIMINPLGTAEKEKLQDFIDLYNEIMDTAIVNHKNNYTNATQLIHYIQTHPCPLFLHFKSDGPRIKPIFKWKNVIIKVLNNSLERADDLWNTIKRVRLT